MDEHLETGVAPQFVGARWGGDQRQVQAANIAGRFIGQNQRARPRPRHVYADRGYRVAACVWMPFKGHAHAGLYRANEPSQIYSPRHRPRWSVR